MFVFAWKFDDHPVIHLRMDEFEHRRYHHRPSLSPFSLLRGRLSQALIRIAEEKGIELLPGD
jgi:hypothetical protein